MALYEGKRLVHWDLFKVPQSRAPMERVLRMSRGLVGIVDEINGDNVSKTTVVIETPGSQNRPYARGLITLGMAVGGVATAFDLRGYRVVTAKATEWTKLNGPRPKPKAARAKKIEELFPTQYAADNDPTLDGADAIGLGAWFLGLFADGAGEEGKT